MGSNGLDLIISVFRCLWAFLVAVYKAACDAFRIWRALFRRLFYEKKKHDLTPRPTAQLPPPINTTDEQTENSSTPAPEDEHATLLDAELPDVDATNPVINETEPPLNTTAEFLLPETADAELPSENL
jgi:hypothetical protein